MPQFENARKYSLFALFAGMVSSALVLLLQLMDPAKFITSALRFSQVAGSSSLDATSSFAFWASISILSGGVLGLIFVQLKNRSGKASLVRAGGRPGSAEDGEENWIFI